MVAPAGDELNLPWQATEGASAENWQAQQRNFLTLLADDANHVDAHSQLAELYFKQYIIAKNADFKRWALYHAQKALATKPQDLTLLAAYYRLLYTQVRMEGEKTQLARLQTFYKGLPSDARNSFFPPSLAFYLFLLEQDKNNRDNSRRAELKAVLQQALKEQPRNGLIHVQLSRYYFDARQIDVGFAILHQALHLEPENPQVVLALAEAYRTRAQRTECVYDHLDDIKRSTQFYKQLLTQPASNDDTRTPPTHMPQVHWGLMINYAHLGLAPLSIREGDQAMTADASALNKWIFATYLTYQNQPVRAEALFATAKQQLPIIPTRAAVEHYVLQRQWQKAAQAFADYIADNEQPGVTDLLLASMIQAEIQDKSVTVASLWRTPKKAVFYNSFDEALAKFWRGDLTEAAFAEQIKSPCQQAEYEFYVGYLHLLNNRVGKAKEAFELASKHPQPMNFEVQMAARFLQGLLNNPKNRS
ncbi:MAG TPA: hypothetical protein PKD17_03215 [Cellvibrionaceae bacterium]|nr:hypothetical protein [Cellvibrionaceae bacterium]